MSITGLDYVVFRSLRHQNLMPPNPKILDLGESNWFGDMPLDQFYVDLKAFAKDDAHHAQLLEKLQNGVAKKNLVGLYEIARVFFAMVFGPHQYASIDPGEPTATYPFDLNMPVPLAEQFDVTMNLGTAEHVFNVYQFFKTAHELTAPGGLMIHNVPGTGWPDHGFYNFQPTFFFDLARTNKYQMLGCVWGRIKPVQLVQITSHEEFVARLAQGAIPPNSNFVVVFRKALEPVDFAPPTQGYYAGTLSPELMQRWHTR